MTIGNHFWSDYLRHVFKAFWRALERTDTLVVGLLILGDELPSDATVFDASHTGGGLRALPPARLYRS